MILQAETRAVHIPIIDILAGRYIILYKKPEWINSKIFPDMGNRAMQFQTYPEAYRFAHKLQIANGKIIHWVEEIKWH